MDKKAKVITISTVITCIVIFVCAIILVCQFIKIANLREKTANLETYKQQLEQQINNYDSANNYYSNTEYLEKYAREVLGWGLDNEEWYTIKK